MKIDPRSPRGWTIAVLESVESGQIDKDTLIRDLLNYMNDSEVADFVEQYDYSDALGIEEDDDE